MELVKIGLDHFIDSLSRSQLSQDQILHLYERVKTIQSDRWLWDVDWRLLDGFKEIWTKEGMKDEVEELRNSCKDRNLSKNFQHVHETMNNMDHYLDQSIERPDFRWNENFRVASIVVEKMMFPRDEVLNPHFIHSSDQLEEIWTDKTKSAGAIGRGSKELNQDACYTAFRSIKDAIESKVPFEDIWIPNMAFHRSQISGYTDGVSYTPSKVQEKDRLVWGMDGASVAVEGQYAKPLIEHCKNFFYSYSGGDEPGILRGKIERARLTQRGWVSIDYSKFDQTVQSWLIAECFDIIKRHFPSNCKSELSWIAHNFIHSYIVLPGGKLIQKHRGIPSGSNFTQIVGSMCNLIMQLTYLASKARNDKPKDIVRYVQQWVSFGSRMIKIPRYYSIFALGDDSLTFCEQEINLTDMAGYVYKVFGARIHPEKCDVGKPGSPPHYLKRFWRGQGEYRNPLDLAINCCHPEFRRTYDGYTEWHILYGLFLIYRHSFPPWINDWYFLEKFDKHGGLDAFYRLPLKDLPGSFRQYGDNAGARLRTFAEARLAQAA